ncbi:hypothetical protein AAC03nite_31960 [Alicyclobacillus acidoterrestris]|nr:hypothetical protein AAC03nite_31960 [Alicyclobacillus acidoterrestris]
MNCGKLSAGIVTKTLQRVRPKVVRERLGHANIGITLDTYSHMIPGLQEAAVTQFVEMLFVQKSEEK